MTENSLWQEEQLLPRRIKFEAANQVSSSPTNENSQLLKWKSKQGVSTGFKNLGNTCFLNSTLQCLLYTPPIQNVKHQCNKVFCVLCALKKLFTSRSNIPEEFLRNIPRFGRQFSLGRQEDAHELLRFLVNRLGPNDFIQSTFGGTLRSKVQCQTCQYESLTYEPYLDLSLEVISSDLEKCLAHFCRKEKLDGPNKYFCERCKAKMPATKQYTIKTAPMILTLHLKRFTNTGKKDMRQVKFPEKLSIDPFLLLKGESDYQLYAVLIHVGYTCRSGHYYAFLKAPNDMWYEANDSSISQASFSRVINHSSAYILFYKRNCITKQIESPTSTAETSVPEDTSIFHIHEKLEVKDVPQKQKSENFLPFKRENNNYKNEPKMMKVRPINYENGEFKSIWKRDDAPLGYVKDEYDRKLDIGKRKKKKNKNKKKMHKNIWNQVRFRH
ncbi:unnamed protein product [Blepharisma stoltei]|uniref:Ubiquitin carboxyl-terminal hydrolase n=1 Tax=Blepharisma stoltei TaxID=1481888 RepID=A0AAU9J3U1_9CILI|nr:unnamed protein product [Blepharisma stoltei]